MEKTHPHMSVSIKVLERGKKSKGTRTIWMWPTVCNAHLSFPRALSTLAFVYIWRWGRKITLWWQQCASESASAGSVCSLQWLPLTVEPEIWEAGSISLHLIFAFQVSGTWVENVYSTL